MIDVPVCGFLLNLKVLGFIFFFEGMKGKMTSIFLTENWLAVMLHVSVADFVKFLKLEFGSLHGVLIGF